MNNSDYESYLNKKRIKDELDRGEIVYQNNNETILLRKRCLKQISDIDTCRKKLLSTQICKNIEDFTNSRQNSLKWLCFYPMENEPDLLEFYAHLLEEKQELYFPICEGKYEMNFYKIQDLNDFVEGKYNIPIPTNSDISNRYKEDEDAICITPGVVFDIKGNRIGHGGGYYDNYFAKINRNIERIAVCFEQQLIENLDHTEFDIYVHAIITEDRIVECNEFGGN